MFFRKYALVVFLFLVFISAAGVLSEDDTGDYEQLLLDEKINYSGSVVDHNTSIPSPNMSFHDQLVEGFKYLPKTKFPQGILRDVGTFFYLETIARATGEFPSADRDYLSADEYIGAYGDLLRSYITNNSQIPDFQNYSDDNEGNPVQKRVENGNIQTISLAAIKYNYLDPQAIEKGNLKLIFANGSDVPSNFNFSEEGPQRYYVETAQGHNQSYVNTSIFTAAALLRNEVVLDDDGIMRFILSSSFMAAKGVGPISDISIKFLDVPESEFMPIERNQLYSVDLSDIPFMVANGSGINSSLVRFVINFTMQGKSMYAAANFVLINNEPISKHCSAILYRAYYPSCRPEWWPQSEWDNRPSNALQFFNNDTAGAPLWWPSNIAWPVSYQAYRGFNSFCSNLTGNITITDSPQWFGRAPFANDETIWGPLYDSSTGAVNTGTSGGTNWAGGLNWRLYPATHRANDPNRCKAENLVIIVDGIDIRNDRSIDTIYTDFKPALEKMLDKGYDVIILDYTDGRDYIQRNGYAMAEVFKRIPSFMKPGYENHRAIVLAGSMGTQTSRYGLVKLEESGVDHHVGLWIALDGLFVGAHVPWSVQGMIDFFAIFKDEVKPNAKGLHSPAARQLLRHHTDFVPDFIHASYYAEVDALNGGTGLPQKLRKVAVASGR